MTRIYQNHLGGELNAALTDSGTSMSSPALAAMIEVASPNEMTVVLDPDGIVGEPEIVLVTAHTASATTATITRGALGSTARAHKAGAEWVHGPLKDDINYGGMVEIASQTLGSAAASITFSGIPATYRDLLVTFVGRSAHSVADGLLLQLNGDTGANYDRQLIAGTGASAVASENLAQTSIRAVTLPSTAEAANLASRARIEIPEYASSWQKGLTIIGSDQRGTATGTLSHATISGWWRSTAAITSITLLGQTANLVAGSIATLYGRGRA